MALFSNLKHIIRGVDISSLFDNIKRLENELSVLESNYMKIKDDNDQKTKNIPILEDQIQRLKKNTEKLHKSLKDKEEKIDELSNLLTKQVTTFKEEETKLKENLTAKEKVCEEISLQYRKLQEKYADLERSFHLKETESKKQSSKELEILKGRFSETVKATEELASCCPYEDLRELARKSQTEAVRLINKNGINRETILFNIEELENVIQKICQEEKERLNKEEEEKRKTEEKCKAEKQTAKDSLIAKIKEIKIWTDSLSHNMGAEFQNEIPFAQEALNQENATKDDLESAYKKLDTLFTQMKTQFEMIQRENERKAEARNYLHNLLKRSNEYLKKIKAETRDEDVVIFLEKSINSSNKIYDDEKSNIENINVASQNLSSVLKHIEEEIKQRTTEKNHVVQRRIPEIFDAKTGEYIKAYQFFSRPESEVIKWRRIFETSIQLNEKRFLCPYCHQMVKISGRKFMRGNVSFFSHLHDSNFCEIKTTTGLSKSQIEARKYGLVAESDRHRNLKALISQGLSTETSLQKGITNVEVEKRIDSYIPGLNWRRPDIIANYKGMNLVFELQLSTTFISVVVQRDIFYRLNNYFIVWVFNFDENEKYVDLTNLMCKDIYYGNKRNIFVFDREAQEETEKRKELVLKCNWLDSDSTWHYNNINGNIGGKFVTLDELSYDEKTFKPYYFDADTPYYKLHPDVESRIQHEEEAYQTEILEKKYEYEKEAEKMQEKQEKALRLMQENGETVIPYADNKKYGLKYKDVTIVQPQFSSCQWSEEYSAFLVTYKQKKGLYDKFGGEIFSCEYLDFHRLGNSMIVAENTQGFFLLGFGKICNRCPHDIISLESLSSEVSTIAVNSYHCDLFIIKDKLVFMKNEEQKYTFFTIEGICLLDETYSDYHFTGQYEALCLKDSETALWKIVDLDGADKNDIRYSRVELLNEFILVQNENGLWGILDKTGETISNTEFNRIERLSYSKKWNNYLSVYKDELQGIYNDKGCIIDTHYSAVYIFGDFLRVEIGNKYGLFDMQGNELLMCKYNQIRPLIEKENLQCQLNEQWYLYSISERILYDEPYDVLSYLGGLFIKAKIDEKVMLINSQNTVLIPRLYDDIEWWHENTFKVHSNEKWGLYSIPNGLMTEIKYSSISQYNEVKTVVTLSENGKTLEGHIDSTGKEIYSSIKQFKNGMTAKLFFGKWGMFDANGDSIIPY